MAGLTGPTQGGEGFFSIATESIPGAAIIVNPTTAPTVGAATTGGAVDIGTHVYAYTDVTNQGESAPSTSSAAATASGGNQTIPVSGIVVGPTGTIARKLYRSKVGTTTPLFLLATIADNTTTTYSDTTADASLGATSPPATSTVNGTPGTFVTPTRMLLIEKSGLASKPTRVKPVTYDFSRDSNRVQRNGKFDVGGPVDLPLLPNAGLELLVAAVGKAPQLPAITSDTTTSIATSGNVSTLVLSVGSGAYAIGQPVYIDTAAQEVRQVMAWNAGTKTMTVAGLFNTHASSGTTITAPACDKVMPITRTDLVGNLLRTISAEENIGGEFSWQYRYGYVGKWAMKCSGDKVDISTELKFNRQRTRPATFTAWNESDPYLSDLPYSYTDIFMAFNADQFVTGTSALQLVDLAQDLELTFDNKLKAEKCMDGQQANRYFPGAERDVTFKLKFLNIAQRSAIWEDFLSEDKNTPVFGQMVINLGTPSSPVWVVFAFYAPNARYQMADDGRDIPNIVSESVEAEALAAGGNEKIYFFIVRSSTTPL